MNADVPKTNLEEADVVAAGVVEVVLVEAEAGVVGTLKLNVGGLEVLLFVFCLSEPKAPVSDEDEGKAVVEVAGGGFGVTGLLGMLKENLGGAFVDEDADGLGCAEGVCTVWG